jgi:hypothetical protein
MHHVGVAGDNGSQFDGELKILGAQVIVSKVEKTDARIPIQRIDYIPRSLLTDRTPR